MSRDIALIGKMRSGKDTAASRLVDAHGFTRLAFADPLKEAALKLDPFVSTDEMDAASIRLSEVVKSIGWERAKNDVPEVRRILQHMGQGIREIDPHFWINNLINRWEDVPSTQGVIVTDVRYENEASVLKALGFRLVRIVRPAARGIVSDPAKQHASETELDDFPCDVLIQNGGSIAELHARVDALAQGA